MATATYYNNSNFFQVSILTCLTKNVLNLNTMAEKKRKADFSLPEWAAKSLECPVCLEKILDPPIFLCEKGHVMCQTCREPLKTQDKPCPVCQGKLLDVRNLGLENFLEQLPKIKCKYEGCTFERADGELVKRHEDEKCRERPGKCELCQDLIPLSKLSDHLVTKHGRKTLDYPNLGEERSFISTLPFEQKFKFQEPLARVNNDLDFLVNWKSYDSNLVMFWVSLCGTPMEAKEYEYTIKIESSAEKKAGRTKYLLIGTGDCISCDVSHEDVKKDETEVMLFSQGILKKAAEGNDEKKVEWKLVIQKK